VAGVGALVAGLQGHGGQEQGACRAVHGCNVHGTAHLV
jgi:hypothetical protein